jgi:hypothetical protein
MSPRVPGQSRAVLAATFIVVSVASPGGQDDFRVSCLPDRVMAAPGETVGVRVWVASASGAVTERVTARWEAATGHIDGQSASTHWVVEAAPVDRRHIANVTVDVNGARAGSCSLGVWVVDAPPAKAATTGDPSASGRLRGEYVTRRAFLRSGQIGERGYGLYSYFLMREPTNPAAAARAARFVGAFLDVLVGVADQENYVERRRLNGSYIPVTADPPQDLNAQQRSAWALAHYDYEHAKRFLSLYPTLTGPGPFIIAAPAPLATQVKPMLPWDFSLLDNSAIDEGVDRFLNQAAQLYDWQNQGALQKLRDQLVTTVAGMFVGRTTADNLMQIVR